MLSISTQLIRFFLTIALSGAFALPGFAQVFVNKCEDDKGAVVAGGEKPPDDPPGISTQPPNNCVRWVLVAKHAYSVCIEKKWNVRTNTYKCCPPDKTIYMTTENAPTAQEIGRAHV